MQKLRTSKSTNSAYNDRKDYQKKITIVYIVKNINIIKKITN